jgi:hypothetical protein
MKINEKLMKNNGNKVHFILMLFSFFPLKGKNNDNPLADGTP